jgi:hypothetical protein
VITSLISCILVLYLVVILTRNVRSTRRDIATPDGTVFLTRWWFIGGSGSGSTGPKSRLNWALMLHKMHKPDQDRCLHDHPWYFISLVLWRGYTEEYEDSQGVKRIRHNRPGHLLFRPATWTHRIAALPNGPCYTLLIRGKPQREWGFHTKRGWVRWDLFDHVVEWCAERTR